ncbi:MAG: hypothetical protein Q9166_000477 [cf. Caloplaca sp. 2 TL-2023]
MDLTNWKKLYPVEPVLIPALKAGAVSGASGLIVGGVAGIIRSSTPGLFAITSGLQCAALGTTYYATRGIILQAWQITPSSPPQDRIYPSTLAGGMTGGTIGGLTRGRANIIPGIIMFSIFGFAGQHLYNTLDARHHNSHPYPLHPNPSSTTSTPNAPPATSSTLSEEHIKVEVQPLWKRILNSKYSPMSVLSDEDYEKLLRKKLLRVEAELAIVEEDIARVEGTKAKSEAQDDKEDGR